MAKIDADRENNRMWAPQTIVTNGPSVQTHGKMNMTPYTKTDITRNDDRISPDLLKAFKENPYTHSLHSVA